MAADLNAKFQLVSEYLSSGRYEQARQVLLRCLQSAPSSFEANNGMAVALSHLGMVDQALFYSERAAALNPKDSNTLNTLGSTLSALGKHAEAVKVLERAVALDPADVNPRLTLANSMWSSGRYSESLAILRRALAERPEDPEVVYRLATREVLMVRAAEAFARCRRALAAAPMHMELLKSAATIAQYVETLTPEQVVETHRAIWRALESMGAVELGAARARAFTNAKEPERKLRIGFVSPDFRAHSVSYFTEPVLENLDRNAFHVTCYSNSAASDEVTKRLKSRAQSWVQVAGMDDATFVARAGADKIDVLVDLAGHSVGSRLMALAQRAAPVQMTYCGYAWTTGVPNIDARIVDSTTDPVGRADTMATETLRRLDPVFLCYRPYDKAPAVGPAPARAAGSVTFGSFNTTSKLNDRVIALWSRVLQGVPGSRLMLKAHQLSDPELLANLTARFAARGIDGARLVLHGAKDSIADHLGMYNGIDVCLDPFPYNGTTTTCEAMWMGVPVVVLEGDVHASRVGVSLLKAVGLPELIASDEAAYEKIAVGLASNLDRLDDMRRTMRERMRTSPLMDAKGHAARFGAVVRDAWRAWCGGVIP